MRIAHLSDLHVLAVEGVPWRRLAGKRLTGYANLRLRRSHQHLIQHTQAVLDDLRRRAVDHVAITGDISNLSLENEFSTAHALLCERLGVGPHDVSLVPGNHDRYTRGSFRSRRFETAFSEFLRSDLETAAGACFPVVKLRGPIAFVGLSTGIPQLPFVAAGEIGHPQLAALDKLLRHPEVVRRQIVLLVHHPIVNPLSTFKRTMEGLWDAQRLVELLQHRRRVLVLHGHLHRRMLRRVPTSGGEIWSVGTTSASLNDPRAHRMAGYNIIDLSPQGEVESISARVLNTRCGQFQWAAVPVR